MTPVERKCLSFLRLQIQQTGDAPSFREIADHLSIRGLSRVHRLLTGLEKSGAIRRDFRKRRAIEIVDQSEISAALNILAPDVRAVVMGVAKAENTPPEIIMAEWIRERAEHERYAEEVSA